MQKKSQFRIVCFLITIMLIVSCFIGCGRTNTEKATVDEATTIVETTVAPTTVTPTTVASTTVKPTEKPTEAPTKAVVEQSSNEEEPEVNDESSAVDDNSNSSSVEEPKEEENSNNDNQSVGSGATYSPSEFQNAGVINWGGWTWTYYSERILPGGGLWIPGRWTDSDGYVCDENGYVCLASTSVDRYSIVETPFGRTGKVYDSGCAYGVMDVYVNW